MRFYLLQIESLQKADCMLGHGFVTKISIAHLIFRYNPKLSKKMIRKYILRLIAL